MEWLRRLLESGKIVDGKLDVESLLGAVNAEYPKHAIPKETYNDVAEQLKTANATIGTLKKEHGDVETLQATIKTHEGTIVTMEKEHKTKINDMAVDAAIEKALLGSKAKHTDLLTGKFDRDKITVKDGTVTGVDEQLKTFKDTYKDLFEEKLSGRTPANPDGITPTGNSAFETIVNNADNMTAEQVAAQFAALEK